MTTICGRKKMKKNIMTVDLEPVGGRLTCKSIEEALPKLLNVFDDHKIKATFFVVTKLLDNYGDEMKSLSKKHEIASHSHTHQNLNKDNIEYEIKTSKQKLEEHGIKCQGFRSPRFITTSNQFELLNKYGYQYDSSLATLFPGRYSNLFSPSIPFQKEGLTEFPMPTIVFPLINSGLSYMKLFHPISKLFPTKYMFYLHPWEFLEKKDIPSSTYPSLISSLSKFRTGKIAWNIFEDYLDRCDCKWISCRDWMVKRTY